MKSVYNSTLTPLPTGTTTARIICWIYTPNGDLFQGELALAEAVVYLAMAPKSNAVYSAYNAARAFIREDGSRPVPLRLRNAPTRLMKTIGYGQNYQYDHDAEGGFSGDDYWPEEMSPQTFYQPTDRGFEKRVAERMAWWDEQRKARDGG